MKTIAWPTESTAEAFLSIFYTIFFPDFKLPLEVGEYFLAGKMKKGTQHSFKQLELIPVM